MATFNITADSVKTLGENKTGMEVTFKADDGREVTCYHEVESVEVPIIEAELQKAADEFNAREVKAVVEPKMEEAKDLQVEAVSNLK